MSEAERDLKTKVFSLVSDYIPTNEPRNAQLARLLGSEMVNVRRQAFIEAAEIAEESAGGSGELLALASKGKDVVGALCHSEGLMTAKIIAAALRAKAEESGDGRT